MELVKDIAAVVGLVLSFSSLLTLVCKPVRRMVVSFITRQSGKSEMERQIAEIRDMLLEHLEADKLEQANAADDREALLCLLRSSITQVYYTYLPTKQVPAHQYKNTIYLTDVYTKLGGNSYVATVVENMKEWDVLPD